MKKEWVLGYWVFCKISNNFREEEDIERKTSGITRLYLELIKQTSSKLEDRLCGTSQLKDKMKPYWEYAPLSLDRKVVKAGKKSGVA